MLQSKIKLTAPYGVAKKKETTSTSTDRVDELIARIKSNTEKGTKLHLDSVIAVKEIHDEKLYLKYADTFYEFCEQMLNVSRSLVYRKLHQLALSEATGQETENVHTSDNAMLISNDLQAKTPPNQEIDGYKPAIFPGSQLPQPEPKKPFKNKRMKPETKAAAPRLNEPFFNPGQPPMGFNQAPMRAYDAYTPQVIVDEIAQWRLEINRRITEQQDNPGFRKALTEWLDESGL